MPILIAIILLVAMTASFGVVIGDIAKGKPKLSNIIWFLALAAVVVQRIISSHLAAMKAGWNPLI